MLTPQGKQCRSVALPKPDQYGNYWLGGDTSAGHKGPVVFKSGVRPDAWFASLGEDAGDKPGILFEQFENLGGEKMPRGIRYFDSPDEALDALMEKMT